MNTVKATVQLLHGGAAPQGAFVLLWTVFLSFRACLTTAFFAHSGLGDLSGKDKLARRFKGSGMRTAPEIGLDLGRRVRELR